MCPIYDNDGTTSYEIGKVYDNDGTTSYQIGKVYDNDGTTNSLIYSADYELFPENKASLTTYTAGSGGTKTRTIGTTELVAQVSGGGSAGELYRAGVRTTNKIDFSKYSKLIVVGSEISDTYGTWSGCDISMSSSTSISGSSSGQSGANVTQSWAWKADITKHNNTWNTFNKEFDISGVTGSYYLWFYAYSYHVRGAGIKCTSVILVE